MEEKRKLKLPKHSKLFKLLVAIIPFLIILNIAWFSWRQSHYSRFTDDFNETPFSTIWVPRYSKSDPDGFDYSVKYPDWLTFTGNLAVGFTGTEENPVTAALIIWPKLSGGYEYGVIISSNEENSYRFYVDANGNPLDREYQEISEKYKSTITAMLSKAKGIWEDLM